MGRVVCVEDLFVWGVGAGLQGMVCSASVRGERGEVTQGVLQEKRSSDWSRACFPSPGASRHLADTDLGLGTSS